jgi:hypothetical protein
MEGIELRSARDGETQIKMRKTRAVLRVPPV